jgi:predicted peroxiredoxin
VPANELTTRTGALVVNLVGYTGAVTVPVDKPVEIWAGGTGFMLIKRKVFEKLKKKVAAYNNDVAVLSGALQPAERIVEYFACSIEPGTERLLSEDYHFCRVARENGIKIWAAPWVRLGHFGNYLFEGGLLPAP